MLWLIIKIILAVGDWLGANRLFRSLNTGKIRVLMYHGVGSAALPSSYWTWLDRDRFAWQMRYVKKRYNVVDPSVLVSGDARQGDVNSRVIVTFDDGLESTYREALPILRGLGIRSVLFVLPALSEGSRMIWADEIYERIMATSAAIVDLTAHGLGKMALHPSQKKRAAQTEELLERLKALSRERTLAVRDYILSRLSAPINSDKSSLRLMSPPQMTKLTNDGTADIGSHTDTHAILSKLTPDEQRQEIAGGLERLRRWAVPVLPLFAYPNGRPQDFTEETVKLLRQLGIKAAVTSIDGMYEPGTDPYRIRRIAIGSNTSRWEFKARLSGFFYFLRRLRGQQR